MVGSTYQQPMWRSFPTHMAHSRTLPNNCVLCSTLSLVFCSMETQLLLIKNLVCICKPNCTIALGTHCITFRKENLKNWTLPVSVDLTIPGLLLHIEKCTDLHNAGETSVQEDWEQQRGREELSCRSVRSQLRVGMSWTHWKTNAFSTIAISLLTIKDWDAYYFETGIRVQIQETQMRIYI